MSDDTHVPADPVASEDAFYSVLVDEYRGLRRAGAGVIEAALLTTTHLAVAQMAREAQVPPGDG